MNETAPVQKQDIAQVVRALSELRHELTKIRTLLEWVHRDDPRAPDEPSR